MTYCISLSENETLWNSVIQNWRWTILELQFYFLSTQIRFGKQNSVPIPSLNPISFGLPAIDETSFVTIFTFLVSKDRKIKIFSFNWENANPIQFSFIHANVVVASTREGQTKIAFTDVSKQLRQDYFLNPKKLFIQERKEHGITECAWASILSNVVFESRQRFKKFFFKEFLRLVAWPEPAKER